MKLFNVILNKLKFIAKKKRNYNEEIKQSIYYISNHDREIA